MWGFVNVRKNEANQEDHVHIFRMLGVGGGNNRHVSSDIADNSVLFADSFLFCKRIGQTAYMGGWHGDIYKSSGRLCEKQVFNIETKTMYLYICRGNDDYNVYNGCASGGTNTDCSSNVIKAVLFYIQNKNKIISVTF